MKIAMKNETIQKILKIGRWSCLALGLALVICQFVPFWTFEGKAISIAQYIWLPTYLKDLTNEFAKNVDPAFKSMNAIGGAPILLLVSGCLSVFLTLFKKHLSIVFGGLTALCGASAIACMSIPIFHHLTNMIWLVQGIIGGVALVAGLTTMIVGIIELRVAIAARTW
ncbi:MAG: hypothetical protein IKB79_03875 [Oscillospiraceae bacterium]|nr:hypothetical protein [Oscillospiraceae bacterium]